MGAEITGFMAMRGLDAAKLIFRSPQYRNILTEMNSQAQQFGLPDAIRVLAEKARVQVNTVWDDNVLTEKVLKEKPVVIIANHEFLVEPLILLSQLPSRKNLHAVAADFAGDFFGGEVQKLTLPISFSPNLGSALSNARSIKRAIELLHEEDAIVIFPKPTSKPEKWRTGIGQIVSSVLDRKDVFLVMADIQDVQKNDIMKLFLNITGVKKTPLIYNLRISSPIAVRDLGIVDHMGSLKEKTLHITRHLENYYSDWCNHSS